MDQEKKCCMGMCGDDKNMCGHKHMFKCVLFVLVIILSFWILTKGIAEIKSYKFIGGGVASSNTISFAGKGEVTATPDVATISYTVRNEAKTMEEAQKVVTDKIATSLELLKKIGILDKDIKTNSYNSYPKYQDQPVCTKYPCPPQKQVIYAYEVSQSIDVKVRDTKNVSAVIDGLGKINITELSGPNYTIDNQDALNEQARALAITDAKVKAKTLARELGVNLVRIVSFQEDGNYPVPMYDRAVTMAAGSAPKAAPVPELPTGENKITSNVTITYEIR